MEVLSIDDLKRLSDLREGACISLFMPTVRAGNEVRQNRIRFKNLMHRVEEMLASEGMKKREVERYLQPAARIEHDRIFWQQQLDGLAVFRTSRRFRYYRLPLSLEELAVVSGRLHVKPLLPLFSGNGRFYLLTLSQKQVRLFLGTHYSVNEVRLRRVPRGLAEAMKYEEVERQLQYHSGTGAAEKGGRRAAVYHGQGAGKAEVKDQILRYFRRVDKAVHGVLRREQAPLVLVGLEYLFPIYRQANTYPHLLEAGVDTNADELGAVELHEKSWAVVAPHFREAQEQAARRFAELAASGRASDSLEEIVPAAVDQRIDSLFVPREGHVWGRFDGKKRKVTVDDESLPENEDLLDLSAVHTLDGGGTIYSVDRSEMPGKGPGAAIFRY
ncbi:MAG: hypothetical protein JXB06_02210 [Spirochaetales bacterium]|nr:hypothetical protein [Spirochaetales bacterium]